jgi:hypothetical protein
MSIFARLKLKLGTNMTIINKVSILFITLILSTSVFTKELFFGEAVNEKAMVSISTLLENPEKYIDKEITISGTIVGVCTRRGCWADIASDAKFEKLRIKVRDGDMVFPLLAKGRQAVATGTLQAIELSLEQTKSYKATLAKRRGETIATEDITVAMSIYQLAPIGVKVLD